MQRVFDEQRRAWRYVLELENMAFAERFGKTLRDKRKRRGYDTAASFIAAVEEKTGTVIKKDTIQRIEAGRQEPKLSQYVAMAMTLDSLFDPILTQSLTPEMESRMRAIFDEMNRVVKETRLENGVIMREFANGTSEREYPDGSVSF